MSIQQEFHVSKPGSLPFQQILQAAREPIIKAILNCRLNLFNTDMNMLCTSSMIELDELSFKSAAKDTFFACCRVVGDLDGVLRIERGVLSFSSSV